jgi:hypothetical protein
LIWLVVEVDRITPPEPWSMPGFLGLSTPMMLNLNIRLASMPSGLPTPFRTSYHRDEQTCYYYPFHLRLP